MQTVVLPRGPSQRRAWLLVLPLLTVVYLGVLHPILRRYSSLFFLPQPLKTLPLDEAGAQALLAAHRLLLLGGPHRGGTTLLWRLLAAHPSVSGFAESVATDFGEGAFLQSVCRSSASAPSSSPAAPQLRAGRYALAPTSHLTDTHAINTNASSRRLVAGSAYHWDLSRPILAEKTPTNMVASRLLQARAQFFDGNSARNSPTAHSPQALLWRGAPTSSSSPPPARRRAGAPRLPGRSERELPIGDALLHWTVPHGIRRRPAAPPRARTLRYEDGGGAVGVRCGAARVARAAGGGGRHRRRRDGEAARESQIRDRLLYRAGGRLQPGGAARGPLRAALALQPRIAEFGLEYDVAVGGPAGFGCVKAAP